MERGEAREEEGGIVMRRYDCYFCIGMMIDTISFFPRRIGAKGEKRATIKEKKDTISETFDLGRFPLNSHANITTRGGPRLLNLTHGQFPQDGIT